MTDLKTKTQSAAASASYMREHRIAWREAGFASVTSMAHEKDTLRIRAHVNIIKFERLLSLIEDGDTTAISLTFSRNTPKMPPFDVMKDLEARVNIQANAGKAGAMEANKLIPAIAKYSKKAVAGRIALEDDFNNDALRARNVVYGNLAVATYKLAEALLASPMVGDDDDT
tara:strand:- start:1407 stop:1919 length:513 start_codon:yes stop_codon:yes gene_type:complete